MKILVTGASGFLGGRLCEELANQKLDYVPVYRKNQPKIQHSLFIHSLNAQTDWSNNFTNVDYVIHCAARVHVMNELESDPLALFREVNVDGTLNLARQAAANGVKVAVVEERYLGGTCVNVGCVPSKNLIRAAETVYHAKHSNFPGIQPLGAEINFAQVIQDKKTCRINLA